ncbi:MAG: septal ring lytic transglycosylase RlpA family protein [bacterium]|nr:septal ring lytic transglycosylase RlpA family protein [bacterium]
MYKITPLILFLLIMNCSFFQRQPKGNREVDGIIYLDDAGYKKKEKSEKDNSDQTAKTNIETTKTQTTRSSNQLDGILFLSDDDQAKETSPQTSASSSTRETGQASYYANKFKGNKTASGELYDPNKFTAAHRTLPFGTMVRVMNLDNKKIVTVKINDRGPHIKSRIIDLSYAAAEKLDIIRKGIGEVAIEVAK